MRYPPIILDAELGYSNWLKVRKDKLRVRGEEKPYSYDVVIPGDGVAVLPFLGMDTLLLQKQHRHPVDKQVLELIQGGKGRFEKPEQAGLRELLEETGYTADFNYITEFYPLPSILDMRVHILEAYNLKKIQEPTHNPLEDAEIIQVPFKQVLEEILAGQHKDSALAIAVLNHYARKT